VEDWTLPIWRKASAKGLILKAHAGEFGPASNIQHAISQLGAKRIQHGVAAHESEMLLRQIVDEGICLDMCPISNFKLQVVDSWQDHPLPSFLKKGIQCTISTDDPFSFNNTLEDEYHACVNKLGLPISDLVQIAKNGFIVSDLSNLEKKRFIEEIDRTWDEFKGNDSSN
jgi:adenosine deaminase